MFRSRSNVQTNFQVLLEVVVSRFAGCRYHFIDRLRFLAVEDMKENIEFKIWDKETSENDDKINDENNA
jgi:hypothetical protein